MMMLDSVYGAETRLACHPHQSVQACTAGFSAGGRGRGLEESKGLPGRAEAT